MKRFFLILVCCIAYSNNFAQSLEGIGERWKKFISLDQYLEPFFKADTILNELVMPIQEDDGVTQGRLLFPVKKILSVKNSYLNTSFEEGKDWAYDGKKLIFPVGSRITYFKNSDLVFNESKEGISLPGKQKGTFVLFSEGELLRERQIAISYIPQRTKEQKGISFKKSNSLKSSKTKLKKKEDMHIVFWGNSIEVGANSSAFQNVSPYMPNWAELFVYGLRKKYSDKISFKNLAVGGMTSSWGLENISKVIEEKPNLVVIGFGMNDGTMGVPIKDFMNQITGMITAVKSKNPNCEFIVISTMIANPKSVHNNIQESYRPELLKLESKGIAIADMTYWHKWLLNYKSYQDMTGNNINHTNDYLSRWYAQLLLSLL